jgi:hypothetical protein
MIVTTGQIIDSYITWKLREGWILTYQAENGAQFTKPKQWNMVGVWAGLICLPIFGLGLIFWIVVIADYMSKKDTVMFVSVAEMEAQLRERRN